MEPWAYIILAALVADIALGLAIYFTRRPPLADAADRPLSREIRRALEQYQYVARKGTAA